MSEFTDRMEAEAREIAAEMEQKSFTSWKATVGDRTNIKPWYSSRSAYRPGAKIAVIGANPGGNPVNPPSDANRMSYEADLNSADYNAYLDESWDGARPGGSRLQSGVSTVFGRLYGRDLGDANLRQAVCFNVCPLRTASTAQIPRDVWSQSEDWCRRVTDHVKPRLVICVANGGESPWEALRVDAQDPIRFARSAHLKYGTTTLRDGSVVRVIGLPHLTAGKFSRPALYQAISEHRDSLLGLTP